MKNILTLLLSFLTLLMLQNVFANTTQVYTLHYQLADALLPVVRNNLLPNESASAYNNDIVVNASDSSQQNIAQLLQQLDKPMRNLLITVRNNSVSNGRDNGIQASGGIRTGEVYLGANGPVYRERNIGGSSTGGSSTGGIVIRSDGTRIETHNTTRQSSSQQEQKLRVIEGSPAWISAGQDIPYNSRDYWGNRTTEYRSANRGFYVTARIMNNRVYLDISTSNDQLSEDPQKQRHGVIETQHLQTTVSGAIGDWINLGGITLDDNNSDSGYTGNHNAQSFTIGDIAVNIVPLD